MTDGGNLFQVLVLLAAAVLAVPLFHRLRVGPVLGYLAAGVAVGPFALALVTDVDIIRRLGELGVVFLLFAIGLELKLSRLMVMRSLVFGLGGLQVVVTTAVLALLAWAGGQGADVAVVVGIGLALSSTAVVLQMLTERGEIASRPGRVAFAVLLMQDLAVAPALVLVSALGDTDEPVPMVLASAVLRAVLVGVFVLALGRLLARPFLKAIARTHSPEAFAAAVLLVVLGTGWVTAQAGLSMALGGFMAGLLLAETEFRHQVEADIQPFRGLLLGLFFMSVGMSLDLGMIGADLYKVLLMLAALMAIKASILIGLALVFRLGLSVAVEVGVLLAQGGEFAFVVFTQAAEGGILDPGTTRTLTLAVTASMMLTPLLAIAAAWAGRHLDGHRPLGTGRIGDIEHLSNHVIIAGFGRFGQTVGRLLSRRRVPFVALDLQPERVAAARARGLPVYFGDASRTEVLEAAGAARALAVVLTLDKAGASERAMAAIRARHPDLRVYARARDTLHGVMLRQAGATVAVPETVEASLQLGARVLRAAGIGHDELAELLDGLRHDDYAGLGPFVGRGGEEEDARLGE